MSTENVEFCVLLRRSAFLCVSAMQRNAERETQRKEEQLLDAEKRRNATQSEKRIAHRKMLNVVCREEPPTMGQR